MSFTSGSETLPSGRTGTVRHKSGQFFHTVTSSTSSGPIRYSFDMSMLLLSRTTTGVRAAAIAGALEGALAAAAGDSASAVAACTCGSDDACCGASCAYASDARQRLKATTIGKRQIIEKPLSHAPPDRPATG